MKDKIMLTSYNLYLSVVEQKFTALKDDVRLFLFIQETHCHHCREIRRMLEKIASITHKIKLDVYNYAINKEIVGQYNIKRSPAIAVLGAEDFGVRYYSVPQDAELSNFLDDIVIISQGKESLERDFKKTLEQIKEPVQLELFISSLCPYSWPAEKNLLRLAMLSDKINLDIIDAMEFKEVAEGYNIHGIPITVINGTELIFGALPQEKFIKTIIEKTKN